MRRALPCLRAYIKIRWSPQSPFDTTEALSLDSLGSFLRLGAGISAWKSYDGLHASEPHTHLFCFYYVHLRCCGRWALRVAPSSGNLQTTELHVLLPAIEGLASVAAAYHYLPELHKLELRLPMPQEPSVIRKGLFRRLILCLRGSSITCLTAFSWSSPAYAPGSPGNTVSGPYAPAI